MSSGVDDPKHWYDRAAEMRVLSDSMKGDETKATMRRLADDYDKLGDRAAERKKSGTDLNKHYKSKRK